YLNPDAIYLQEVLCVVKILSRMRCSATSPRAARAARPPRAQAATLGRCGAEQAVAALHGDVCARRPSLDSPREAAARLAAAGALHHPQRAPADGGVGLQLAVPVVCGLEHGRSGLGRHGVLQEPGAVAEG